MLSLLLVLAGYGVSQGFSIVGWARDYWDTPKLEYDTTPLRSAEQTYYLRVRSLNKKTAKNCAGLMALLPDERGDVETVWEHLNGQRTRNIDTYADLRLFQVDNAHDAIGNPTGQSIIFPSAHADREGWASHRMDFDIASKLTLRLKLTAEKARLPEKPFTMNVLSIIQGSKAKLPE